MSDPFALYYTELTQSDLDQKTTNRYWQIVSSYRKFLNGRSADAVTAKEFLAYLREKGYGPSSILLYYHALRRFFNFLGINLKVKLRKRKELPRYHHFGDIEALIAQAKRGLRAQTDEKKERNAALIETLAFTGMRKSELLALRVADIDFERMNITVRQGKGRKDHVIPMLDRIAAPLRSMCEGKPKTDKVFDELNKRSIKLHLTNIRKSKKCNLSAIFDI